MVMSFSKFHALLSSYTISQQTLVVANVCFHGSFFFWKRNEKLPCILEKAHIENSYSASILLTPATINSIKAKYGWVKHSEMNFRQNYKRVASTLQLAQDLEGARAQRRNGESYKI